MASLTACPGFKSCYDVPHYKKIYTASVSSNIKRKMSKTVPWTCPVELFTGRKFGGRFVCLFVCFCGAVDGTQGLMYHWASPTAPQWD